jgi:hypothetical protein
MRVAVTVCHARFLDLAAFEEPLRAAGYEVHYVDAGYDDLR